MPNFNTTIPQQAAAMPSPLEQYGKMLQLRALSGQIQQQQQMQPLQVEQAQQSVQAATLENQQRQQELESQKAMIKAWSDPDFLKGFTGTDAAQASGVGFDPNALTSSLISKGVLPKDAMGMTSSFVDRSAKIAETLKAQAQTGEANAAQREKGMKVLADKIGGVLDAPAAKAGDMLTSLKQDLVHNPQAYAGVPKDDLAHVFSADLEHLPAMATLVGLDGKIAEFHSAKASAMKTGLEVAAPTVSQLTTFTNKTIPGFSALRPEQKQAFIAEAGTARTADELNKIVERADATDKAEQMHADSLAQTLALKGQAFGQKGLEANDKTWTDPQHGYLQTLSQAKLGKAAITAGADGNGLLTSLEPTMAVLGMNSFAGVHRISPAEATAAGAPGGWAEQFTAWADKAASGKLSPQLAKEGNQLFDQLIDSKYQASLQASEMHASGYGIPRQNVPVMTREGETTTLDKAPKTKTTVVGAGKTLSSAAIQQAATDHGVSVDEVKRQAKAAGYTVQ